MLEVYKETPIFIPVYITKDVVESVTWKLSSSVGAGGIYSEALQGWLLKFGYHSKKLCISVEYYMYWLANQKPLFSIYQSFISGRLITLDKLPFVRLVGFRETWCWLFAKCVLKVTRPEATHAYEHDQICAGVKAVIDEVVHTVQYIWDANSTEENYIFLLVDTKNAFNDINGIGMLWTFHHLWMSGDNFVLNFYRHHYLFVLRNGEGTAKIIHIREGAK